MRKSNQKKLRKKIDIFSHRKKSKFKKSRSSQSIDVMFFLKNVHDIVWVTQSLSYFENFFFLRNTEAHRSQCVSSDFECFHLFFILFRNFLHKRAS